MRFLGVGCWILILLVAATGLLGVAANSGLLIWAALPLTVLPIVGLSFLRPREELAGWALFTVWLGTTYLSLGPVELVGAAAIVVLAVLGYFRSPWFLVAAWLGHIPWDFVPRDLPERLADLPVACLVFDGLIGVYLIWRQRSGHWLPAAADPAAATG